MIKVLLQPEGRALDIEKAPNVLRLLKQLNLRVTDALIIRDGRLLTYDVPLNPGDEITIRRVVSRG
jgi:sulfur carrier protein